MRGVDVRLRIRRKEPHKRARLCFRRASSKLCGDQVALREESLATQLTKAREEMSKMEMELASVERRAKSGCVLGLF